MITNFEKVTTEEAERIFNTKISFSDVPDIIFNINKIIEEQTADTSTPPDVRPLMCFYSMLNRLESCVDVVMVAQGTVKLEIKTGLETSNSPLMPVSTTLYVLYNYGKSNIRRFAILMSMASPTFIRITLFPLNTEEEQKFIDKLEMKIKCSCLVDFSFLTPYRNAHNWRTDMQAELVIISTDYPNPGIEGIKNTCTELALVEKLEVWTNPWTIGPSAIAYHERLVKFCKLRNIQHIYVWNLIDLTRCSMSALLDLLIVLMQEKIHVHIVGDDLPCKSVHGILASLRVWELQCKSLAQKASIARQQAEGKAVGRPPKSLDIHRLRRLEAEGKSTRDIAEITGLSHTTVIRRLAAAKAGVVPQTDGRD